MLGRQLPGLQACSQQTQDVGEEQHDGTGGAGGKCHSADCPQKAHEVRALSLGIKRKMSGVSSLFTVVKARTHMCGSMIS